MHVQAADILNLSAESSRNAINAAMLIQFFTAMGIFLFPALLFAYFTHPKAAAYLGLVKPGKMFHWFLIPVLMISATPVLLAVASWISQIDFGASVKQSQEASDRIFKAFLTMPSAGYLIFSFFVLAIVPGFSEELFFRGILMRFAAKRSNNAIFPLVVSSLMFALMHSNIYGIVSIFLAGFLLGGIYYLTGSLWCSILAHAFYNGTQVVIAYLAEHSPAFQAMEEANEVPLSFVAGGFLVFAGAFYLLWKNRTPLPGNWSADYTEEELAEEKS